MKRWVTEKMYHDDYKRTNERVEDMNYSAMLVNVDAIRGTYIPDYVEFYCELL